MMETQTDETRTVEPVIQSGTCYVLFAYDVGRSINLESAERRIQATTQRQSLRHRRRAPSYFEYQPHPLRVAQEPAPLTIGKRSAIANIDLVLYDFGAMAVIYNVGMGGPLSDLLTLSEDLYDNEFLQADSRQRIERLMATMGDAIMAPDIAPAIEDYVIFHVEAFGAAFDAEEFCAQHRLRIAQILRAERQELSAQEVDDALAARCSFGRTDLTIIDWNAALLIDREGDDVREVLEFANVELLEMRHLDQRLDRGLDRAYESLSQSALHWPLLPGRHGNTLRAVAELQIDNALLFEGVNNTLKLLGDQYLARVYRAVNRRFHLDEWDASILRKLQTLESIYEKISDQAANWRLEGLEWIIVLLIAFEIILGFIR